MLDPISVAGLALAVFDEVLKLGAKTAEVISEMRTFDDVSRDAENHRYVAERFGEGLWGDTQENPLPNMENGQSAALISAISSA